MTVASSPGWVCSGAFAFVRFAGSSPVKGDENAVQWHVTDPSQGRLEPEAQLASYDGQGGRDI
jgi:hypothetical protein